MKKSILLYALMLPMFFPVGSANAQTNKVTTNNKDISRTILFDRSMTEGVNCYRIPAIVTAKNGDLIAAVDQRITSCWDMDVNDDINLTIRISKDNGKTWGDIRKIVDFPKGESASDASMVVDKKTGKIFMFYNYRNLKDKNSGNRMHVIYSKNNGKTWSEPRDITEDISERSTDMEYKFITSGRACYTTDGWIMHTLVNFDNPDKALTLFYSKDHGKTWEFMPLYLKPANESKFIELPNGDWVINSRVEGAGMRYIHLSKDHGETWMTYPEPSLPDPACNGSIIKYSSKNEGDDKDRILFSNLNNPNGRSNLTVRLSYDNGKTWKYSKVIHPDGCSYSSMTVLHDGRIAIFYEKENCGIEVAIFDLAWLTDGADTYAKKNK